MNRRMYRFFMNKENAIKVASVINFISGVIGFIIAYLVWVKGY